jgi:predicted DNA-binding protein YlxM (UPF0122 family)
MATENFNINNIKEARNLLNEIKDTLANIKTGTEQANTAQTKGLKDYETILKNILEDGELDRRNKIKRANLIDELVNKNMDLAEIAKKRASIQRQMAHHTVKAGSAAEKGYKVDLKMLDAAEGRLKSQKLIDTAFEAGDNLTGGMLSKAKGLKDTMGQFGTKVGLASAGLAAAVAILISFSAKLDTIGQQFGAIGVQSDAIKGDLLAAEVEATKLGKSLEDVITVTTTLSDEFGVAFSTSRRLSASIIDTSVALGLGVDEGAKLVGVLTTTAGLSADTAQVLAKQVTLLANANDVAPQAVLRDIANSAETIALFTEKSGQNIARAAIQARRFGVAFGEVAGALKGTLDFESSIRSELEASVLLGRQLNLQKVRELTLTNQLEAAQNALVKELGSAQEFSKLNVIQKEALAAATGLGVDQISKFVSQQKEAVSLAGQLAGQPGFDQLIGPKAISDLVMLQNQLKSFAALLVNVFGPILTAIMGVLNKLVSIVGTILSPFNDMIRGDVQNAFGNRGAVASPVGRNFSGTTISSVPAGGFGGGNLDSGPIVAAIGDLKSEMRGVNSAVSNLRISTKVTNKELNMVLTPHST